MGQSTCPPGWTLVEREALSRLVADRDRYGEALEAIRDQHWVENVLDPQWAARIAKEALAFRV